MNTLIQLLASGLALGALYALVSISFVVLVKATGHFNLLPGATLMLGAYFVHQLCLRIGMDFFLSIVLAIAVTTVLGLVIQRFVFEPIERRSSKETAGLAIFLITIGILSIAQAFVVIVWGSDTLTIGDPWKLSFASFGDIRISYRDLFTILLCGVILLAFWVIMQHTKVGVAMRALATDMEAGLMQGINPRAVAPVAWAMSSTAAVVAGTMLATEAGGGLRPTLDVIAFTALPALIIGGLHSLPGVVIGGFFLGLVQMLALGYAPQSWGEGFAATLPWFVLIVILMVRPGGLVPSRNFRRA